MGRGRGLSGRLNCGVVFPEIKTGIKAPQMPTMTERHTWPEQDAVDAWLKKYGIKISRAATMELKQSVTRYRVERDETINQIQHLVREIQKQQ